MMGAKTTPGRALMLKIYTEKEPAKVKMGVRGKKNRNVRHLQAKVETISRAT